MRHKYSTRGIVLGRLPLGEANGLITVLTPDLGLLRARAQGIRKPGAKLAAALATYAESEMVVVRGKEGWRITGAMLSEPWFTHLAQQSVRERAGRISGLLLRLVPGETAQPELFPLLTTFFQTLTERDEAEHDAAECFAALSTLSALGLDAGDMPGTTFDSSTLANLTNNRREYVLRINRGIEASGL